MAGRGIQSVAQQLQSFGRGPDTMLAHISPDEAALVDYMQGGRRTNPVTGLPEYGLFGKILKGIARAAGAIGGFMVGGPAGAAAGSAAMTKLTGGSWKSALTNAALSGIGSWGARGLMGGGWSATGGTLGGGAGAAAGAAAGATAGAATPSLAAEAAQQAAWGIAPQAAASAAPAAGIGGAVSSLNAATAGIGGVPALTGGVGAIMNSDVINPPPPPMPESQTINLDVEPDDREYIPFGGDYSQYGSGGEHKFFSPVNPTPKLREKSGVAAYDPYEEMQPMYMNAGGVARMNPRLQMMRQHMDSRQEPDVRNIRMMGRMPIHEAPASVVRKPPVISAPPQRRFMPPPGGYENYGQGGEHRFLMADGGYARGGRSASRASAAARQGHVKGHGDGKSDEVPAMLSTDEHVTDAATTALLGNGSSDAGHRAMEEIKREIRRQAGMKNVKAPPGSMAHLVARAKRRAGVK